MNIAHIVPYSILFPLSAPNGRYSWVHQLAILQAKNGHDVTIYCNPQSSIPGVKVSGISIDHGNKLTNNMETFRLAFTGNHDIFHSHFDDLHYHVANETSRPIIFTQHWWPSTNTSTLARSSAGNIWAVPPTKYMYEYDISHGITTNGYIYHGIDLNVFAMNNVQKNGRLLFIGRIAPEKNVDLAIRISTESGIGLDIIGKVPKKHASYWGGLQNSIDGFHIRYLGTKNSTKLPMYYSAATALLFPSDVNEPFGLVAIEAQACGTPVLMKQGGSRSELIKEGSTGYLCQSEDDFVRAAHKVGSLNYLDCVKFASRFSIENMEWSYLELYKQLV